MGGDGATTGHYALVHEDAGGALLDQGVVRFTGTGNEFTSSAVGVSTPIYRENAAFCDVVVDQTAMNVRVLDFTPSAVHPPSRGDLSDTSVFAKLAKPLIETGSMGSMGAFELSQATPVPHAGGSPTTFQTANLPSGGCGFHWHPDAHWQAGKRVILHHDNETRTHGKASNTGLLRPDAVAAFAVFPEVAVAPTTRSAAGTIADGPRDVSQGFMARLPFLRWCRQLAGRRRARATAKQPWIPT